MFNMRDEDQQSDNFELPSRQTYRSMATASASGAENRIDGSLSKKMLVCAVVFAFVGGNVAVRVMLAGDGMIKPNIITIVLLSSALVGATLGAVFALKDRAEFKLRNGQHVAFPLRMIFGCGVWSLFFFWVPLIHFFVLIVLLTVLIVKF